MMDYLPTLFTDHGEWVLLGAVALFLLLINVFAFVVVGLDKLQAEMDKRRVKEGTLTFLALIGGGVGAKLGQVAHGHRPGPTFGFLLNLILIVQIGLAGLYLSPMGPRVTEMAGVWAGDMMAGLSPAPAEPERTMPKRFGPGS